MKRLLVLCLALFMTLGLASVASAAPYVFADADGDALPDTYITLRPCETIQLDFYVTGLLEVLPEYEVAPGIILETGNLITFSTNVYFNQDSTHETFDPSQVSAVSGSVNAAVWDGSQVVNINPYNAGAPTREERMAHVFLMGAVADPDGILGDKYLLGSILFHCDGPGDTVIDIAKPNSAGWLTTKPMTITDFLDWDSYDVTVHNTPIPSAVLLLGSALVGLVSLRRRNNKV